MEETIPQLNKDINLTTTSLLVRFTLSTFNTEKTPRVLFLKWMPYLHITMKEPALSH